MKRLNKISTKGMERETWLQIRRKSLGGSDAAGIVGLSRYSSPFSVWADKTGRSEDKPDSEAMKIGRDLEEYVAKRWCEETGKRVRHENNILYNPDYPFAHANPDRMVIGEDAGLECKTTSTLDVRQFKGVEFPEKYYCQCVHYLAVTGAARWYLAVLVFGRGFFTYTLERDQSEIDALMQAEGAFWELVKADKPPAPDGAEATGQTIGAMYPDSSPGSIELFGRQALLDDRSQLIAQREDLDFQINAIENTIKEDLQTVEKGCCGPYTVSWKSQERRTFQYKQFAADNPGLDLAPYFRISHSRPFKITKEG